MKETFYFSHDYNARNDCKLINLQIKHGMAGIGIYWCLVEMIYEEAGYLLLEYERISYVLRIDKNVIQSVINDFDLFQIIDNKITSTSIFERINQRANKSEKARLSVQARWNKYERNTNVSKNDTIKEKKEKDKIEKDINKTENINEKKDYLFYLDLFEKIEIDIWEKLDYDKKMKRYELMETEFINSESWLINISRNINVSFDVLKIELSNFLTEIQLKTEMANTFPNNKNYFINWLKSKNKEKVKINNYQNKNNQKSHLQELTEINRLADLQIDEMYGK